MTDVVTFGDKSCYIDGYLKHNITQLYGELKKDDDFIIIITGKRRSGKSVLAQTIAWYLSEGKLTIDNVAFLPSDFKKKVQTFNKGSIIIFDECYLGLASSDAMGGYNRLLKKILYTCGCKNLVMIFVLPNFWKLDSMVVEDCAKVMIHVKKKSSSDRFFYWYDEERLASLYLQGKKDHRYYYVKPNFWGRTTDFYAIDEEAYRLKKQKDVDAFLDAQESKEKTSEKVLKRDKAFGKLIKIYMDEKDMNQTEMGKLLGIQQEKISFFLKFAGKIEPQDPFIDSIPPSISCLNRNPLDFDDEDGASTTK